MNRNQKSVYCFIYDESKQFYRAIQQPNGSWKITHNAQMYPIKHNPKNLSESTVEFGTNKRYFSMARSIGYPLEFILDGAAILNSKYLLGKGFNENIFLAIFEFDSEGGGMYKLSYNGRFDFQQKKRDEKVATFTVPVLDDSAWGILSQNDEVEYAFDCSENNPKSVKVLIDNFTLKNRYTFQTVQAPITHADGNNTYVMPFVLVNQDGDSSGIVANSQTFDYTNQVWLGGVGVPDPYVLISKDSFFYSFYALPGINIQGSIQFTWSTSTLPSGGLFIFFRTSLGQTQVIFSQPGGNLVVGKIYTVDFNFNIDLAAGERLFLFAQLNDNAARLFTITPITTNIFVTTLTKIEPAICFGLRPLDLLQEIVNRATRERYSINSDFFTANNNTILMSGDSIRGIKDAKIYTSFRDFFETFSSLFFMALRVINGSLFMELADVVYSKNTNLIDLGEIIECETSPAIDYIPNEIEVGSPKQDYRHPSGRLEFNDTMTFSLPFINVKNKVSLVTKYRTDCYGIIFLLLDYRGGSTQDNSGDKTVFVVDVTEEVGSAAQDVETFENINVVNAPLAPIIKYPLTGDIINNNKPLLKGIGISGSAVNIYIADALDGGTFVDGAGNWSYQIQTALPSFTPDIFDGVAIINATNTDMLGAIDTIQLIIDTTVASDNGITYPRPDDSLYNNLPLLKGVAPPLNNIDIFLDGLLLASVVSDNSCKWEFKCVVPIGNGNHTLDIGTGPIPFNVNSFVALPLITYIGSELDGFPIVNNLPLIRGVGLPGTNVTIWLNYISYSQLGNAIIDANGDWSYQVIPISYIDPITHTPVLLAPIRNGLSIISTLLINNSVKINVTGFKLNRPAYDSITGVIDNTIFNTRLSPKRMMLNHKSLLSAIMDKQRNDFIAFETADKNSNLVTTLGTEVISERANIEVSSLGSPIAVLEQANIKVVSRKSFSETLYDFNNGGTIKGTFKGNDIFFLPIGSMKMKSIMDDVQEWSLLISPQTSYNQLLNLYKNGLTINVMQNSIFHSDYNSLHIVTYNFAQPDKYNFKSIYDDWFTNRNDAWSNNPQYIQKYQKTEIIRDQVITNGISSLTLRMYRCKDTALIHTFNYNPINPAPIPVPEIVMEAVIDFSAYPEDQYFFVQCVDELMVGISERVETRTKWHRTILLESSHSVNSPGVFFSSGFKTIIRVEGLIKKLQPSIETVIAQEESGDSTILYSNISKKRIVRLGTAQGFPDYMAIKCACAVTNNLCQIEGEFYTLDGEEKLNPSEDIEGVPMYHYDINMKISENSRGKVFAGQEGANTSGVIIVVDATAIGLPESSLIMIDEN